MSKIYRYKVERDCIRVKGHVTKLLCVDKQYGETYIWVKCDDEKPELEVDIIRVGTGEDFDDSKMHYLGTVVEEPYVWHYFWKTAPEYIVK